MKLNKFVHCHIIVILTAVTFFFSDYSSVGQDEASALTLGAALDKMMDQLQQAISDARNAGSSWEIQAGEQLNIAIESARNAYADSLNKTVDQVNTTVKGSVDQLQTLVNNLQTDTAADLQNITSKAQQIVNSLPFRQHEPQLTTFTPNFIVPSSHQTRVTLQFQGNFEFSSENRYAPTLTIENRKVGTLAGNTTQSLKFFVSSSDLFTTNSIADENEFAFTNVLLKVPWQSSSWLGLIKHRKTDEYHILIGALPASPGKIVLNYLTTHPKTHTQTYHGPNHHQASTHENGNMDDRNHDWSDRPDDGWQVVRGTVQLSHIGQGDYSGPDFISDDGNVVVTRATTIHHGIGGSSGSIDFSVTFQESQTVSVTDTNSEVIDLKWGDSKILSNLIPGKWNVAFDAFDGTHSEFAGAESDNRYINIKDEEGSEVIAANDPSGISF